MDPLHIQPGEVHYIKLYIIILTFWLDINPIFAVNEFKAIQDDRYSYLFSCEYW